LIRRLLPFCLTAVLLYGCAGAKPSPPAPPVEMPVPPPPPVAPSEPPPALPEAPPEAPPKAPAVSPADKAFVDGMVALQEGRQERALELFSIAWKERPGHPGVSQEFDGALQALKKSGDAAYAQGNHTTECNAPGLITVAGGNGGTSCLVGHFNAAVAAASMTVGSAGTYASEYTPLTIQLID